MSRIGNLPISLPAGVSVDITDTNLVSVKGPLGELTVQVNPDIKVEMKENTIELSRPSQIQKIINHFMVCTGL